MEVDRSCLEVVRMVADVDAGADVDVDVDVEKAVQDLMTGKMVD